MKRGILTCISLLIFALSALCLSSCTDSPSDPPSLDNTDFVTFYPTEPNTSGAAALEAAFRESDYYDDYYTYSDFSSYLPEFYAEKYGVDIFGVTSNRKDSSNFEESYYVIHKNTSEIFLIQSSNKSSGEASDYPTGITHLALSDVNGDGLFELLISSAEDNYYDNNYITIFDSKSISSRQITLGKSNFGFFKKSDGGRPAIYTAESCDLTAATELYSEIKPNMRTYSFDSPEYHVTSEGNYEVLAAFDLSGTEFPIYVKGIYHLIKCQTVTTYWGEAFLNPAGAAYCPAAKPQIFGGNTLLKGGVVTCDNPSHSHVAIGVTVFYDINPGDKLYTTYRFQLSPEEIEDGDYSLSFEYVDNRVELPSVFTVKTLSNADNSNTDKGTLYNSGALPDEKPDKNEAALPSLDNSDFISFYPSAPSSRNVEAFEKRFIMSDYHFACESPYVSISSIMPEIYSEKYGIDLFRVDIPRYTRADYYLFFNNRITLVHSAFWGSARFPTDFSGIVHLALTDVNSDGCVELLISSADRYRNGGDKSVTRSKITVLDTKSGKVLNTHLYRDGTEKLYGGFAYFKKTENGGAIFCAERKSYDAANELYCDIIENPFIYAVKSGELSSQAEGDFRITFEIRTSDISFPIYVKGMKYSFMAWLTSYYSGEPFKDTFTTGPFCITSTPALKSDGDSIEGSLKLPERHYTAEPYEFEVESGYGEQVDYYFTIDGAEAAIGSYDVYMTAYDGSVLVIEDVLTVSARD